jgi:hypothetical protein
MRLVVGAVAVAAALPGAAAAAAATITGHASTAGCRPTLDVGPATFELEAARG